MSYLQSHIPITKKIHVELDLSSYGTKSELRNATGFGTSDFGKKS